MSDKSIFERLKANEEISMNDPEYGQIRKVVEEVMELNLALNNSKNLTEVRNSLSKIIDQKIPKSTTLFTPFHTNFGKHITLGENVFINHDCSFLDLGGITIDNDVMIAPRVNISSENHPVQISKRKTMIPQSVHIKKNAWIGAGVTILPGVTIGENTVIAAGAVVNKNIPANVVAAGVPAKVIKKLK